MFVPCEALWCVLKKYGAPLSMLSIVHSLHDGMLGEVTVNGQVAPEFEVCNGLRQGCVIAPTIFNLYFALVMEQWRSKCKEFAWSGCHVQVWGEVGWQENKKTIEGQGDRAHVC